ncbi:hypothetical protein NW070_03555 [Mycoplasmopsis cynos]|nr:hypothetical protein [Mycoplasmopsis cynos]UWV76895.1 hypothetical protein NW070_03555 [Mycoplasmopsis cynos]
MSNIWKSDSDSSRKSLKNLILHKDFHKGNESSKVADLASWSKIVRQDSSQAAMFLKEFTKDVDFIHCDINGTADINGEPQGPLIATLVEFVLELQK